MPHALTGIVATLLCGALILAQSVRTVDAQTQAVGVPTEIEIGELVDRFLVTAEEYHKIFRNLTAEETKVIEVYRASGEVEKRREIVSDLLVYHSSRHGREATTEYRDVRSVDGKAIEKRGERALKLLSSAGKAKSLEQELEMIDRETHKYEFGRRLRGSAVNHGGFTKNWREAFHVEWAGREQIGGREVVVLDYRQIAASPPSPSRMRPPREFGNASLSVRGRLWLDAETAQLRRNVWELAAPHPAAPAPLAVVHSDIVYVPSRFGIPVPERIVFEWRERFRHPKQGVPSLELSERTTFTYGTFKRFEVSADEKIDLPASDR